MLLPQPSEMVPHAAPCAAQVLAVQPQALAMPPPPQLSGAVHLPQSRTSPHPSDTVPQLAPRSAQVFGRHGVVPQRFGPLPPQNKPVSHSPHSTLAPHPSGTLPHSAFAIAQVVGTHPPPSPPSFELEPPVPAVPSVPASASGAAAPLSSSSELRLHDAASNEAAKDATAISTPFDRKLTRACYAAWPPLASLVQELAPPLPV